MKATWMIVLLATGCIVVEADDKDDTGVGTDPTNPGEPPGDDDDVGDDDDDDTTPPEDTTPPDPDDDLDGFPASVDCDDMNSAINPGALETCDGIDNNCDTGVDDAAAATILGVNHATLDEALDAAVDGTTIDVCPGAWTLTSRVLAAGTLTVHGIAGSAATTLSEAKGLPLFSLDGAADLTLSEVTVSGSVGTALEAFDQSSLLLVNSVVSGNGQGIAAVGTGTGVSITLDNSSVTGNLNPKGDGGGILGEGGVNLNVSSSDVSGNTALNGGGIYMETTFSLASLTLTDSTVTGNTATTGGGIYVANVPITGDGLSSVSGNTALEKGGGIALVRSDASGLLVDGNSAASGGGIAAVYSFPFRDAPMLDALTGVVLSANTADVGGGAFVDDLETMSVDPASAVVANLAPVGGGVYLDGTGSVLGSDAAQWGTSKKKDDNNVSDVATMDFDYIFEGIASFSCVDQICTPTK